MEKEKIKKSKGHKVFILVQLFIVLIVIIALFSIYPRASLDLNGNTVEFKSVNAKVIILSKNPDFSNPRFIDILNDKNISFNLKPGTYYWKAGNDIIEGFVKEFKIDSEVGLEIIEKEESSELKNVGNVKINVTKTESGGFVGHIILEPDESEKIKDGEYVGRQDDR